MSQPINRQTRPYNEFDGTIAGFIRLHRMDTGLIALTILFMLGVVIQTIATGDSSAYGIFRQLHFHLSRYSLVIATLMFVLALYIGLRRHADVTLYFRRGVYVVVGTMLVESLIGLFLYFGIAVRPHEDVHLIYGMASVLALPFFIFVEKTAEKRPAMGSYMWGFAILAGVIIRSISTGAA